VLHYDLHQGVRRFALGETLRWLKQFLRGCFENALITLPIA
jgi:hypothetical protein